MLLLLLLSVVAVCVAVCCQFVVVLVLLMATTGCGVDWRLNDGDEDLVVSAGVASTDVVILFFKKRKCMEVAAVPATGVGGKAVKIPAVVADQ